MMELIILHMQDKKAGRGLGQYVHVHFKKHNYKNKSGSLIEKLDYSDRLPIIQKY
jgi:hypothetical protein